MTALLLNMVAIDTAYERRSSMTKASMTIMVIVPLSLISTGLLSAFF